METAEIAKELNQARREGKTLREIFEFLLSSYGHLTAVRNNPFALLQFPAIGEPEDFVDMTSSSWTSLPTNLQIIYATAYQAWYACQLQTSIEKTNFMLKKTLHPDETYSSGKVLARPFSRRNSIS